LKIFLVVSFTRKTAKQHDFGAASKKLNERIPFSKKQGATLPHVLGVGCLFSRVEPKGFSRGANIGENLILPNLKLKEKQFSTKTLIAKYQISKLRGRPLPSFRRPCLAFNPPDVSLLILHSINVLKILLRKPIYGVTAHTFYAHMHFHC